MTQTTEMGARIKECRLLSGYTREEVAEKLDITPRFYYDIELGLKGMSVSTLYKLCTALKIPSDYILFGESGEEIGLAECISLFKQCPIDKRQYLNRIISEYINAFR